MVVSLFHGVDNILECILFVLICDQYMLCSSSYVLYVPKSILSVLSYVELEIVVCSDKFVGTALVPTKLVGTAVPTNLSEQTSWCSNRN